LVNPEDDQVWLKNLQWYSGAMFSFLLDHAFWGAWFIIFEKTDMMLRFLTKIQSSGANVLMSMTMVLLVFTSCSDRTGEQSSDHRHTQPDEGVLVASNNEIEKAIKNLEELNNKQLGQIPKNQGSQIDGPFESFQVDEKPQYPGGYAQLIHFVAQNTVYPKEAKEKGIEGTVYVKFVVSKSGKVTNTTIMRTVDPFLEMEALRIVNSLPLWKPGKKDGKPVDVWFILPIHFRKNKN
jgi:TonB family protein